jgi:hypothetical protein
MKPSKPIAQIMEETVRGEHDAWPLDPTYPPGGSHEDGFKAGDNQRVLWEIYQRAGEGKPIPRWAANAFRDLFIKVMSCELSWGEAFGQVPAGGHKRSWLRRLARNLPLVGHAVQEYSGPKDETMRTALGKKLGLGRAAFIDFYRRWRCANRS